MFHTDHVYVSKKKSTICKLINGCLLFRNVNMGIEISQRRRKL